MQQSNHTKPSVAGTVGNIMQLSGRIAWLLAFLFIFLSSFFAPAEVQTTFERIYGGPHSEEGLLALQTADVGYIVVGFADGLTTRDVYLIKTDSLGDTLWTKHYDSGDDDLGYSVRQTADNGYVLLGYCGTWALEDVCLIRTDSLGEPLWTRTYGGAARDQGHFLEATSDGYLFGGLTWSSGAGECDVYLVRTDSMGDTLWTGTYGGSGVDAGHGVQQTLDGGFIIIGETWSFGTEAGDVYLIKVDSLGDTLWTRTYGGASYDLGYSVQQIWDRGYILVGSSYSFGMGGPDVYLIRTDSLGDSLWTRTCGDSGLDYGVSIAQAYDGGFIIAGTTQSPGGSNRDLCLIRTDSAGSVLWTRTYGGSDHDYGHSVQRTSDGGYIVSGTFGTGDDVYLIKTDENGLVARDVAVVSIDAFGDTVFSDSVYPVRATVRNLLPGFPSFDAVLTIDGFADTSHVVGLFPGVQRQVSFEAWHVPWEDSCTYTLTVCAEADGDIDTTNDCMQKTIFAYRDLFHDVAVTLITAPVDTVFCDSSCTVRAIVANFGNVAETLDVTASIDGYADTVYGLALAPYSWSGIQFDDWQVPPADSTEYSMVVSVHVPGDIDTTNDSAEKIIFAVCAVGVSEEQRSALAGSVFRLYQNNPNPFHGSTAITYSIPVASRVSLEVFDISGRTVEMLVNETQQPGIHQVRWDTATNPGGVYFYRLGTRELVETRKMVILD